MLLSLTIQNLAIIESVFLDLTPGLTVITGETGAGKSLLLQALKLLRGDRVPPQLPSHNSVRIEGRFSLNAPQQAWLKEQGMDCPSLEVSVCRIIQGNSKFYVNQKVVSLTLVKTLMQSLLMIHSQHQQQDLLLASQHLKILDEFSDHGALAAQVEDSAKKAIDLKQTIQQFDSDPSSVDSLQDSVEAIQSVVQNEDWSTVYDRYQKRIHWKREQESFHRMLHQLGGDDTAILPKLHDVIKTLSKLQTVQLASEAEEARLCLVELEAQIRQICQQASSDSDFEALEHRVSEWHRLARQQKVSVEQLPEHQQYLNAILAKRLDADRQQAERLQAYALAVHQYQQLCQRLSQQRTASAQRLQALVLSKLEQLDLPQASFELVFNPNEASVHPQGFETVVFHFTSNPQHAPRPLHQVASGGELSRLSLILHTLMTSRQSTLILDEIDTGLSGRAASQIGEMLTEFSQKNQVIAVTHQAQLAAKGQWHYRVEKQQLVGKHISHIRYLTWPQRVEELARMLDGAQPSDSAHAHAKTLLQAWLPEDA